MKTIFAFACLALATASASSFAQTSASDPGGLPSLRAPMFIRAAHSGKCLHQHGATQGNGDALTQWDCVNQNNVKWWLRPVQDRAAGTLYNLSVAHSGKCAHVHGAVTANGTPITQWDCVPQANLQWSLRPAGGGLFYIVSALDSNKCLHQHGAVWDNGGAITLWDCVDQPNVKWRFETAP